MAKSPVVLPPGDLKSEGGHMKLLHVNQANGVIEGQ